MKNQTKFYGYHVVAACFVILFMHVGALGTLSVFLGPLSESTGIPITQVMMMGIFMTASAVIMGVIAPSLIAKISAKRALLISSLLFGLQYFIYSLTTGAVLTLYIGAAVGGIALAMGTQACVGTLLGQWFIEKRAEMTGIVFGGAGFGQAAWHLLSGVLIENFGVRTSNIILAGLITLLPIAVNLLFVRTPEAVGQKPLGWEREAELQTATAMTGQELEGMSAQAARKTSSFWIIFFALLLNALAVSCFSSYVNIFLTDYGYSTVQASGFTSFRGICSAVSVMASGVILAKLKIKPYTIVMLGCTAAAAAMFAFVPAMAPTMVILVMILSTVASPSGTALVGSYCTAAFGNKDYGKIMGLMMTTGFIGGIISPVLASMILNAGGNYRQLFEVLVFTSVIAAAGLIVGISASPYARQRKMNIKN